MANKGAKQKQPKGQKLLVEIDFNNCPGLYSRIEKRAKADMRSIKNYILYTLKTLGEK